MLSHLLKTSKGDGSHLNEKTNQFDMNLFFPLPPLKTPYDNLTLILKAVVS
jgi:hypothetical protein